MCQPPACAPHPEPDLQQPALRSAAAHDDSAVEALVAARVEQLLGDMVDVVFGCKLDGCLSSVLESAASLGKHQLLGSFLQRFNNSSTTIPVRPAPTAYNEFPDSHYRSPHIVTNLSVAIRAAAGGGQPHCLCLLLGSCTSAAADLSEILADYDGPDSDSRTALMMAACGGHAQCVRLLLEHSPEDQVEAGNYNSVNALMFAAKGGHTACLRLLLEHSPQSQLEATTEHEEYNAIMFAAEGGHTPCLRLLLERSPTLDQCGAEALQLAAEHLHVDCLKLLLRHACPPQQLLDGSLRDVCRTWAKRNTSSRTHQDKSAADNAACMECAHLLLAHGAQLPKQLPDAAAAFLFPVIRDLASRALVPDAANEAVLGLAAAAATGLRKRQAGPGGGGDAAQPAKCNRTNSTSS